MDISILLEPAPGENPSGTELRNDARFHALQRLLEPAAKSVRALPDGTLNPSATPVSWDEIARDGFELAKDGRDLRLLVMMVRAAYAQDGFSGLLAGLNMLHQTLKTYWDNLHPALRDRDTADAATLPRTNALKQLENDDNGLLGDLKYGVVLSPRGIGPIMGHELAVARMSEYEMQAAAIKGLSQAELDEIAAQHTKRVNRVNAATGALFAEETDRAQAMLTDLKGCETALDDICASFKTLGKFGDATGLTLPETTKFLQMVRATLEAAMTKPVSVEDAPAPTATLSVPPTHTAAPSAPGTIASRADVEAALDGIIAFYDRTEPSSPIPLLAARMRRMVRMDFLELMEEVAPSGMKEFRSVAGMEGPQKK